MKFLCFKCGREARTAARQEGKTKEEAKIIGKAAGAKEIVVYTDVIKDMKGKFVGTKIKMAKANCPDCGSECWKILGRIKKEENSGS